MNPNNFASRRLLIYVSLIVLLILFSYWIFIDIYRLNAFNIIPHDDYAPYLLYMLGEEGGTVHVAPFAYRIIAVAAGIPFFYILPFFEFSLLEDANETYLRAVEALAMVSYVSMLMSCVLIYMITCNKFRASSSAGIIASLATLVLFQFSASGGVDPIGIMMVCLLVYYSGNPIVFGILIIISAGINEKISLIFSILMISRVLFVQDKRFIPHAISSVLAFAIYLSVRTVWNIPGGEHQLEIMKFFSGAIANMSELNTLKRFVLDVAQVLTLLILYILAAKEWKSNPERYGGYFSPVDITALLGLFLITMAVGIHFNSGRIAIFCFAFYLPLAVVYVDKQVRSLDDRTTTTQ